MKQDSETAGIYEQFVRDLLAEYLEHPDTLKVECYISGKEIRIAILPAPTDYGRVLGQHGRGLSALRVLLTEKAMIDGQTIDLQLVEPENRVPVERTERYVNKNWNMEDSRRMGQILTRVIDQSVRIAADIDIKPGEHETILTIRPRNGHEISMFAATALNTIFRAIGFKNGRKLTVNARH